MWLDGTGLGLDSWISDSSQRTIFYSVLLPTSLSEGLWEFLVQSRNQHQMQASFRWGARNSRFQQLLIIIFILDTLCWMKLQYFGRLMWTTDSLEKTLMPGKTDGRRSGRWRMRWLEGIADTMDMNLSKLQETVEDRGAWHAVAHGVPKSWTWLSDWTTTYEKIPREMKWHLKVPCQS